MTRSWRGIGMIAGVLMVACSLAEGAELKLTHGPMLGRPSAHRMGVWGRTSGPGEFWVAYGLEAGRLDERSKKVTTTLAHDNTGVAELVGLRGGTRYYYRVMSDRGAMGSGGSFRTMPSSDDVRDAETNPEGLFNFSFEFGCGNYQGKFEGDRALLPTFVTMNEKIADEVDFAILNGDFIYETDRVVGAEAWRERWGVAEADTPRIVQLAPTITGAWQNYKTYLRRGVDLAKWHRNVPSFFTLDDHELLNDVYGGGTIGFKNRKVAFRDIGMRAWFDYVGWSNPQGAGWGTADEKGKLAIGGQGDAYFSTARLKAGSDVLEDPAADFTSLDIAGMSNLLVHWGGELAGENLKAGDEYPGLPNAGVYRVKEVIDGHRLRIEPAAEADSQSVYSIGRLNHSKRTVGNCDIYFLDTRSYRDDRDVNDPAAKGVSMLGDVQRDWLMGEMAKSEAEFFFVVSSVNFMVPHTANGREPGERLVKGEAWTVYLEEREKLIEFWDGLGKPVMLLTGDLHNSFAIKITENIWEFASGPHNSLNHPATAEGNRPATGAFQYGPRGCDILWSTYVRNDVPRVLGRMPNYCVVRVNNVFNNPTRPGEKRSVAFERPQVLITYYDGITGRMLYTQSILAK
jgi:alkaline phosphatase D